MDKEKLFKITLLVDWLDGLLDKNEIKGIENPSIASKFRHLKKEMEIFTEFSTSYFHFKEDNVFGDYSDELYELLNKEIKKVL